MEINERHFIAMRAVEDGADVYSRLIAELLTEVSRARPGWIEITKPMMYDGDGTDQVPYFGAILTPDGLEAMDQFFEVGVQNG